MGNSIELLSDHVTGRSLLIQQSPARCVVGVAYSHVYLQVLVAGAGQEEARLQSKAVDGHLQVYLVEDCSAGLSHCD